MIESLRAKLFSVYAGVFGRVPFRDRYGLRYYLWTDTRLVGSVLQGVRTDDSGVIFHVFKILEALAARRGTIICFDVGAYIGVISLAMASRLRASDVVHAFEPSFVNYGRLLNNIRLNRTDKIIPNRLAVSDASTSVILKTPRNLSESFVGNQGAAINEHGKETTKEETVQTERIDSFAARNRIAHIDLLKIDAEYHDDKVLSGCGNLLNPESISYLIYEFQEGEACAERCWRILESSGYAQFFIVRNGEFLVRRLSDYPRERFKPVLNALAISPVAPYFAGGLGLDVR
ncbi:MAG: FkbM family methyltransferase [Verrucomicrobia bacterium]|nr:FkbM family methyltransferase [Verrucomicrobiota bacterium]